MKVTYLLLIVALFTLIFTPLSTAENEQWLQYCWSADAQQMLSGAALSSRGLAILPTRPGDAQLPEFNSKEPLFARWITPMAKSGGILIALDSKNKYAGYDVLYIDSNGDGNLKDETPITSNRTEDIFTFFGPAKVIFQGEDGPITYHVNIQFYNYDTTNRSISIITACWYEGTITVGGVKKNCILIDNNVNGTFNDKAMNTSQCDRIIIGEKGGRNATSVGNLMQVDDQLYKCEIARDGAFIKLTKADDIKFGDVNVPKAITSFTVCGENGFFNVPIENGIAKLPEGKYLIDSWLIDRKDATNNKWQMSGRGFAPNSTFAVTEKGKVNLDIGEPILSSMDVRKSGSQYTFNLIMRGRSNETITLMFNNAQAREPKLTFLSRDGKYNKAFSLKYG
jgi:hypothetical protein